MESRPPDQFSDCTARVHFVSRLMTPSQTSGKRTRASRTSTRAASRHMRAALQQSLASCGSCERTALLCKVLCWARCAASACHCVSLRLCVATMRCSCDDMLLSRALLPGVTCAMLLQHRRACAQWRSYICARALTSASKGISTRTCARLGRQT